MSAPLVACLNLREEFFALLRGELAHYGIRLAAWDNDLVKDAPALRSRLKEDEPCAIACALYFPFEETLEPLLALRQIENPPALIFLSTSKSTLSRLPPPAKDVHFVGPPYEIKHVLGLIRGVVWAKLGDDVSTLKLRIPREP